MSSKKKEIIISLGICLGLALILSLSYYIGIFSSFQTKLADNLYGGRPALNKIIILAIDDQSLQDIGRWPWPRDVFSKAIQKLEQAKIVGIDVAFFENSEPAIDAQLGRVIKNAGNVVLAAEYIDFSRDKDGRLAGNKRLLPVPAINDHKPGLGYINVLIDQDGITRSLNQTIKGELKSFSETIYERYWGKPFAAPSSHFLINFTGPPFSFETISFSSLVSGKKTPDYFKNKIVLIGSTAPDLHDEFMVPTSFGKAMPGVEVHANAIQTMISKKYLTPVSNTSVILLIFLFSCAIWLFLNLKINKIYLIPLDISFIAIYVFAAIKLFDSGMILNLIYIPLAIIITSIGQFGYLYYQEKKSKAEIMGAFGKYVSPLVIDQILQNPDELKLGGTKKRITVFFSDIRGFTSISEALTPEGLVNLLNEYLTVMTAIILDNHGLVDKYIGDAVMAFWGAPLPEEKQEVLACQTSLKMIKVLRALNAVWEKKGLPRLEIGIGIHTGDAVVGNMGSQDRFDYTAMGDNINLGSRLEGLNKPYGTGIIISKNTCEKISDQFSVRELDAVRVKGKHKPVVIFELVEESHKISDKMKNLIHFYESGLKLYRNCEWDKAISTFRKVLEIKNDPPSNLFIKRCEAYKNTPPDNDWDGVFSLTTK
jgi:adenylate cyclase